jgi:hypothetical protein
MSLTTSQILALSNVEEDTSDVVVNVDREKKSLEQAAVIKEKAGKPEEAAQIRKHIEKLG